MKTLKLFMLMSCFALIFSLTACGGEKATEGEGEETKTEEVAPKPAAEDVAAVVDSAAALVDSIAAPVDTTASEE